MKLNNRLLRQTIRELEVGIINQDRFLQKLDRLWWKRYIDQNDIVINNDRYEKINGNCVSFSINWI